MTLLKEIVDTILVGVEKKRKQRHRVREIDKIKQCEIEKKVIFLNDVTAQRCLTWGEG